MIYLEMFRDEVHGGADWAFPSCLWAPTEKDKGRGNWPYWSSILQIATGDTVLHLRGRGKTAHFAGYSIAASSGYVTKRRPPEPGIWGYAKAFCRADLKSFVPFPDPQPRLDDIFAARRSELDEYYTKNKLSRRSKKILFFARQKGKLQCQNGAYLSPVDDKLFSILFPTEPERDASTYPINGVVATDETLKLVRVRVGQDRFSRRLRELYRSECCFPSCTVREPQFLVASHIARWSDNVQFRGHLGNALCLCLMHDKAFELGFFTLTDTFEVSVDRACSRSTSPFIRNLRDDHGKKIRLAEQLPLAQVLAEHRERSKLLRGSST